VHSLPAGVHFQLSSANLAPNFFSALGGERAPSGYAHVSIFVYFFFSLTSWPDALMLIILLDNTVL